MENLSILLKKLNLKKKNNRVFYSKKNFINLNTKDILKIAKLLNKDQKIFRICLHNDDKCKIHEMIIVHLKPQKIGPLKQNKNYISYHLLRGELKVKQISRFQNKNFHLHKNKKTHIRIKSSIFRIVESLKPMTVFLEISEGPFKDSDTIWKI